jgi:creatinine amidohydrolase
LADSELAGCSAACLVATTNRPARIAAALVLWLAAGAALAVGTSVHIEELTWTELSDRLQAGSTTMLVPIGGTEQNGPHMVLGKHNVRVRMLAGAIAQRLGSTLVAPVLAYVPEGAIDPPAAHMRFAGTLSISEATFEALLDSTARSLRQHGVRDVVFLGDHGGYQKAMQRVATRLNREWAARPGCRVHALLDYYQVTQGAYVEALKARGFTTEEIGSHAGLADTALALAVEPALVRQELLGRAASGGAREGVYGDPRRATAELGGAGVEQIVATSAAAIRVLTRRP